MKSIVYSPWATFTLGRPYQSRQMLSKLFYIYLATTQHNGDCVHQSVNHSINLFVDKYHMNRTKDIAYHYQVDKTYKAHDSRGALIVALKIKKLKHYT